MHHFLLICNGMRYCRKKEKTNKQTGTQQENIPFPQNIEMGDVGGVIDWISGDVALVVQT